MNYAKHSNSMIWIKEISFLKVKLALKWLQKLPIFHGFTCRYHTLLLIILIIILGIFLKVSQYAWRQLFFKIGNDIFYISECQNIYQVNQIKRYKMVCFVFTSCIRTCQKGEIKSGCMETQLLDVIGAKKKEERDWEREREKERGREAS